MTRLESEQPPEPDQATTTQRRASDPAFSVWVSANAGTGKTRVLIDRISRLLLSGVRPERILCLTYTKAAAAEMENRISSRLGIWATMDDEGLRTELLLLNGSPPQAKDVTRARRLFAEALEAHGGLKIRTVHAFCESVLGRFPVEAQIAPHASIMDDRAVAALIAEAQAFIYQRALGGEDKVLANALTIMAGLIDEGGFGDLIGESLNKRRALSSFIQSPGASHGIAAALEKTLGLSPGATVHSLLTAAVHDSAFEHTDMSAAVAVLETGAKGDRQRARDIAKWLSMSEVERLDSFDNLYKPVFLRKDDQPCALRNLITKNPAETHPAAKSTLLIEQDRIFALSEAMKAAAIKDGTQHLVTIAANLIEAYGNLKRQRALLDYDDLILKTLDLLERDGGAGWVHYKLDGGIDHILVDEAQDTNPEQWDVIRHLATEFFAGEGNRPNPTADTIRIPDRSVFAVGDEKQSIYSFQGADPARFMGMKEFFTTLAGEQLRSVQLKQSFRSTGAVLNVVDAVFARPEAQEGVTDADGTRHRAHRGGHAGVVELWPSVHKLPRTDPAAWDAPVDQIRETSPMAQTAETIARAVCHWLRDGENLESRGRSIEAGDIMILVRKRGQFADDMVRRLKVRGIPVAGSDRMVMTDQIAIMDLIAVARFVLLPDDDLNLATVLKGPFINLSEDELFEIAHNRTGSIWQSVRGRSDISCQNAVKILGNWLSRADFSPPFEFFSALLGPDRGRQKLLARLGPEANDPIDEFLNQAIAFEKDHTPSLQSFLAWIDAASTEIKRDMEAARGKVRIMTVHGSKGLEANIVILPDTCSSPDGRMGDSILWASGVPLWPGRKRNETEICRTLREELEQRRMAEYRRLMYVAMTRARDRLYITGWERKSRSEGAEHGRDEDSWYELVRPALETMNENMGIVEKKEDTLGTTYRYATSQQDPPEPDDFTDTSVNVARNIPEWISQTPAPEPVPSAPLSPSQTHEQEPAVQSPLRNNDTSRFRRGTVIHRLLQTLPDLPPSERQSAAMRWVTQTEPTMSEPQQANLVAETLTVLDTPQFAEVFAPGSLAEVSIAGTVDTKDGPRTIAGQVDRLVVTESSVIVVDYKTNRPPPTQIGDVPGVYIRQMALYKSALEHIYEGRNIRCLLVWTDGPQAMMLDEEILSSCAP